MQNKFLIVLCLFGSVHATAQNGQASITPVKPSAPGVDYKQIGAPMPRLAFVAYHDNTVTNDTTAKLSKKKQKLMVERIQFLHENQFVTGDELSKKGNLFVMIFNPTCLDCEDQTFLLEKNMFLFKKSEIVLLASNVVRAYLPDFSRRHHIDDYPQMHIGTDSSGFTEKVFLSQGLPQINIYNRQRKLIKTYAGGAPIIAENVYSIGEK